ncbi:MAG: GNAT family N-acetyltransferase [Rhodospirillales bacterium]|nr:GNAT family N-acetyltransferase [Rhodospirillales bacterium]
MAKAVSGPVIRPSRSEDLDVLQAIYAHYVLNSRNTMEFQPPDLAEMAQRRAAVLERGLPHLVAEEDGRLLGFAYAGPYRARPGYAHTVEDSIYLAPEAIGCGIGRALLGRVIESCTEAGFRQMVAVIGDGGNTASIRLHEALGFHIAGRLEAVCWKFGRWSDCVLMQRKLGAGKEGTPPY